MILGARFLGSLYVFLHTSYFPPTHQSPQGKLVPQTIHLLLCRTTYKTLLILDTSSATRVCPPQF